MTRSTTELEEIIAQLIKAAEEIGLEVNTDKTKTKSKTKNHFSSAQARWDNNRV